MSIPSVKSQLLQELQRSLGPNSASQSMAAPPPAYTHQAIDPQALALIENDNIENDLDATHSPINIKISCPITIIGDGNLIGFDPAEMSSSMAKSIIRGFKDCSMAHVGIPMIDEEGRPRPMDVQVDAGIIVRGTKNTVGKKAVLFGLCATRDLKRRREQGDDDEEQLRAVGNEKGEIDADGEQKKQRLA